MKFSRYIEGGSMAGLARIFDGIVCISKRGLGITKQPYELVTGRANLPPQ